MIYAKNNIEVPATGLYSEDHTYLLDSGVSAVRLDLQVIAANEKNEFKYGDLIVQVTESDQHVFENPYYTEQRLPLGFSSREFPKGITGFRVRSLTDEEAELAPKPCLINLLMYG